MASPQQDALRRRSVTWIVSLATVGLVFDGYDLVVYGTVVPLFLRDPGQIGEVTPAVAGALGSYALIGVLAGALLAGSVADVIGRRKVMLTAYAWFSVGMALTALATTTTAFGLLRFKPQLVELLLQRTSFVYRFLLGFPAGFQFVTLLAQVGNLPAQKRFFFLVIFAPNGFALNFQLHNAPVEFVEFFGHRVHLEPQFSSRFVHQVNGLVGQEPVGDVAGR